MVDDNYIAGKCRPSTSTEIMSGQYEVSATIDGGTVLVRVADLDLARALLAETIERPKSDHLR